MDVANAAAGDLVARLVVSRRWIAIGLGVTAVVAAVVGVTLLVTRDREQGETAGQEVDRTDLPDGAKMIDLDGDGVDDLLVIGSAVTDLRPDNTVSTAWIAGISAIVSSVLTAGASLTVTLLAKNDKEALEELGKRIEEHTHPGLPVPV